MTLDHFASAIGKMSSKNMADGGRQKDWSVMDVSETAEHCRICIPGPACVVRFVTCLWPQ